MSNKTLATILLFISIAYLPSLAQSQNSNDDKNLRAEIQRLEQNIVNLRTQLATATDLATRAHERLSGITLKTVQYQEGKRFACGGGDKMSANDTWVMSGSLDGTGCNVHNQNYFKLLTVEVPN